MTNFEKFMLGIKRETPDAPKADFNAEYELALAIGKKRFGSECRHEKVTGGKCANCLRTVYNKRVTL
jgi:hypothetical protein